MFTMFALKLLEESGSEASLDDVVKHLANHHMSSRHKVIPDGPRAGAITPEDLLVST